MAVLPSRGSARQEDHRRSRREPIDVSSMRTAAMLNSSETRSLTNLLADDIQQNQCIGDQSNGKRTQQVNSDSEPEAISPNTSSADRSIGAPEQVQRVTRTAIPRLRVFKKYEERIHKSRAPAATPFCVFRRTKTLEVTKRGRKYFKVIEGIVPISSLPYFEQNAAYEHALTQKLSTSASENNFAGGPDFCADNILPHYHLHLSRLAAIRMLIRELTVRHRRSAKMDYNYIMLPLTWRPNVNRKDEIRTVNANRFKISDTFESRVRLEREERGVVALLQRCEERLKDEPGFRPREWPPAASGKGKRWEEGRRGWTGSSADDAVTEGEDDERPIEKAEALTIPEKALRLGRKVASLLIEGTGWEN